jgi:TRAP-type transport system periplasmic protein
MHNVRFRTRRKVVFAAVAALVISLIVVASAGVASGASDQTHAVYTIRVATPNPQSGISSQAALLFQRQVQAKSKGKIAVDVFFAGQLGSLASTQTQVQQGSIQMLYINASFIEPYDSDFEALDLPFLFPSLGKEHLALQGPAGKALASSLKHKAGLRILGWGTFGYSPLYSTKRLASLEDFKGTTSFSTGAKVSAAMLSKLGMQPTAIDFSEVYTALQQGTLNSVYVSDGTAIATNIANVAKYRLPWKAVSATLAIEFNNDYFKKLPTNLQKVVIAAAQKSAQFDRTQVIAEEPRDQNQLNGDGVKSTSVSRAFRSAMANRERAVWQMVAKGNPARARIIHELSAVSGVNLLKKK